jgi:DnaJ-class molecular chaperone|tara:strand:+ start:2000 stop:2230 length:231 start_codon:yes stop_codon:yes gene_type:complete
MTRYLEQMQCQMARNYHQSMLDKGYVLCPECGGHGECEYERPVVDWERGGYLEEYMDTCEHCSGDGYVEKEEDDEI